MKIIFVIPLLNLLPAISAASQSLSQPEKCTTRYDWTSTSQIETITYTSTTTSTSTKNTIYLTVTVTFSTETFPTPSGFAPILSETNYVSSFLPYIGQPLRRSPLATTPTPDAVISLDNNGHPTHSETLYPAEVICTAQVSRTKIKTMHHSNDIHSLPLATRTTTTVLPASTYYAACASNNIAYHGFDKGVDRALNRVTYYNSSGFTEVAASNPYDCCVACMTNPSCAFSSWVFNPPFPGCDLSFVTPCDGSVWRGSYFSYQTPEQGNYTVEQGFWLSNGACG